MYTVTKWTNAWFWFAYSLTQLCACQFKPTDGSVPQDSGHCRSRYQGGAEATHVSSQLGCKAGGFLGIHPIMITDLLDSESQEMLWRSTRIGTKGTSRHSVSKPMKATQRGKYLKCPYKRCSPSKQDWQLTFQDKSRILEFKRMINIFKAIKEMTTGTQEEEMAQEAKHLINKSAGKVEWDSVYPHCSLGAVVTETGGSSKAFNHPG